MRKSQKTAAASHKGCSAVKDFASDKFSVYFYIITSILVVLKISGCDKLSARHLLNRAKRVPGGGEGDKIFAECKFSYFIATISSKFFS
jgi:hypothetical protein